MSGKRRVSATPYFFVSYSSREAHVALLLECLQLLFRSSYKMEATPSALESGASQRDVITKLIEECSFAIVVLDGLRPNVVFEYGMLHASGRPVILLKERSAEVDIRSFFPRSPSLDLAPAPVNLDSQFSNVKDVNYAEWSRWSIKETVRTVWREFRKKKGQIKPYKDVPEPKIWDT